jgi:hypothetical protein
MKELLFKSHQEVSTQWGKVMDRMQHAAQYDGNNVINLPPCITVEEFKQIINYVRKHIYRVWVTTPNTEKEDVREKVLETLVSNCMQGINKKKFNAMMEYIMNQNLLEMMKVADETNSPCYQEIMDDLGIFEAKQMELKNK